MTSAGTEVLGTTGDPVYLTRKQRRGGLRRGAGHGVSLDGEVQFPVSFHASRGGDGGAACVEGGEAGARNANGRLWLNQGWEGMRCEPTRCCFDRAHSVRVGAMLVCSGAPHRENASAAEVLRSPRGRVMVPSSKPRRYPPCLLNGQGLACDSVFDATYEASLRLAGVCGVGVGSGESSVERLSHPRTRDLLRPRIRG